MAKKKNNSKYTILENVELKPQVIGHVFQKKSNLGRVIFIFIAFLIVIYYINDISVFINNLIGRNTAPTIKNPVQDDKENDNEQNENPNNKETTYYTVTSDLSIIESELTLNNFKNENNTLTFDVNNLTNSNINLSNRKYFIETYSEDKTLLERFKVDFNIINANTKTSLSFNIATPFSYIVLVEKTVADYPAFELPLDETTNMASLTCSKENETLVYNFNSEGLNTIKHTITDNDTTSENYYLGYTTYQNKINNYKNIDGVVATFNGSLNGYTAIIDLDLANVNLDNINEKYYYGYKEQVKVVKFEMEIYGFTCS